MTRQRNHVPAWYVPAYLTLGILEIGEREPVCWHGRLVVASLQISKNLQAHTSGVCLLPDDRVETEDCNIRRQIRLYDVNTYMSRQSIC